MRHRGTKIKKAGTKNPKKQTKNQTRKERGRFFIQFENKSMFQMKNNTFPLTCV